MSFDEYVRMCREKDYDIRLGKTIAVDVTDVSSVDIEKVCSEIETALRAPFFLRLTLEI